MDITPLVPAGRQIVEAYGAGRFRVSGTLIEGSAMVFPDRSAAWEVADIATLEVASLAAVIEAGQAGNVEILLLGCGPRLVPPPRQVRETLRAAGVIIEPMDTGAACRTYNLLMAEGRRVAAALIAVP